MFIRFRLEFSVRIKVKLKEVLFNTHTHTLFQLIRLF